MARGGQPAEPRRRARRGAQRTAAATSELPDGLFGVHEIAWQVTVRGHLTTALGAIPIDAGYGGLRYVIGNTLATLEAVDPENGT